MRPYIALIGEEEQADGRSVLRSNRSIATGRSSLALRQRTTLLLALDRVVAEMEDRELARAHRPPIAWRAVSTKSPPFLILDDVSELTLSETKRPFRQLRSMDPESPCSGPFRKALGPVYPDVETAQESVNTPDRKACVSWWVPGVRSTGRDKRTGRCGPVKISGEDSCSHNLLVSSCHVSTTRPYLVLYFAFCLPVLCVDK